MNQRIVVVGASGQGREVEWTIREMNAIAPRFEFRGYIVSDLSKLGENDSRERVLGDYSWLVQNRGRVDCVALGIGTPGLRLKVAAELQALFPELEWPVLVHPNASYDRATCRFGRGVFLSAGVVATVNVQFDDFSMANFGCTIGHEARLGAGCVVNPGANISGGVRLHDGVLVGTGAQILQYCSVGAGATIGAGALVTRDVPAGVTVIGIPAKARA